MFMTDLRTIAKVVKMKPRDANQTIKTEKCILCIFLASTPTMPSLAATIHIKKKVVIEVTSVGAVSVAWLLACAIMTTPQKHAQIPTSSMRMNCSPLTIKLNKTVQNAYVFWTICIVLNGSSEMLKMFAACEKNCIMLRVARFARKWAGISSGDFL